MILTIFTIGQSLNESEMSLGANVYHSLVRLGIMSELEDDFWVKEG